MASTQEMARGAPVLHKAIINSPRRKDVASRDRTSVTVVRTISLDFIRV
jgi:hypothetical protein